MLTTAPKEIRENIARAMGYLRRDEVERALVTMSEALRICAGLFRSDMPTSCCA